MIYKVKSYNELERLSIKKGLDFYWKHALYVASPAVNPLSNFITWEQDWLIKKYPGELSREPLHVRQYELYIKEISMHDIIELLYDI